MCMLKLQTGQNKNHLCHLEIQFYTFIPVKICLAKHQAANITG